MTPFQIINMDSLMQATSGRPEIIVGLIDGPVESSHPDIKDAAITTASSASNPGCKAAGSSACLHGTFVAAMLCARRGSRAPAICPDCTFLLRPIFCEETSTGESCPSITPRELAAAVVETVEAGARIINLSMTLSGSPVQENRELTDAFDYAFHRGVLLIAASGNHGHIGHIPLFNHRWVIPVAACDSRGRVHADSNVGPSIGLGGLMAPGVDVVSASPDGGNTRMTGTSAAAPFVTGAAALLWSLFPNAPAGDVRGALAAAGSPGRRKSIIPPVLDANASWRELKFNR